jgi:tetratricopeptide (TPR) repeat protein
VAVEPTITEFAVEAVQPETKAQEHVAEPEEIEIDVSNEWEDMLTVESEAPEERAPLTSEMALPPLDLAQPSPEAVEEATEAPERLDPEPQVEELAVLPSAPLDAGETTGISAQAVSPGPDPAVVDDKVQEIRFYISQGFWDMARAVMHDLAEIAPENPSLSELQAAISAGEAQAAAEALNRASASVVVESLPQPMKPPSDSRQEAHALETPVPASSAPIAVTQADEEIVLELEDEPVPAAKAGPQAPPVASVEPVHVSGSKVEEPQQDILGELVSDLEESLGDFVPAGAPPPEPTLVTESSPVMPHPPALSAAPHANGGMQDAEAASVLGNILSELQRDLGEDAVEAEDPETHYNLGIAFKEMGLLDEAIGELQKVCHAVEVGNSFSQPVQAYTWLAQCLVDKGVPEAAIRWYQKALELPGLDYTSRCAIYYDLGSAFEASGDTKSALANFMEVYSSNIDFRDVAIRIKVLKS